jgi:hypothetical protein
VIAASRWNDGLAPGQLRLIDEAEWFGVLESTEPVHQWGPALLVEDGGADGLLRLWLRDDSGDGRHRVLRLDAEHSGRAREGLERIEAASGQVADLLAQEQQRGRSSPDQLAEQQAASDAYVATAETLYRELVASIPT